MPLTPSEPSDPSAAHRRNRITLLVLPVGTAIAPSAAIASAKSSAIQVGVDRQRRGDLGVSHEPRDLQRWPSRRDAEARVGVAERVELQLGRQLQEVTAKADGVCTLSGELIARSTDGRNTAL